MDFDLIGILLRWMHLLAAVTAVGGTAFIRLALLPSMGDLPDESRKKLHEAIRAHWSKVVMIAIGLLIFSGMFNAMRVEQTYFVGRIAYYRPLLGIKILLALAVFYLASALLGTSKFTEPIRNRRRLWLTVNLLLGVAVICISGVLRMAEKTRKPVPPATLIGGSRLENPLPRVESPINLELRPHAVARAANSSWNDFDDSSRSSDIDTQTGP